MISFLKQLRMKHGVFVSLSLSLFLTATSGQAENLGVQGSVYDISEPDMLEGIENRLLELQSSGEIEKKKNQMIQASINQIMRPKPVLGISRLPQGQKPLIHDMDPSIEIKKDILDREGRVLAKKGQKINPLNHMNFTETLVFLDGDDPAQVSWIHPLADQGRGKENRLKIILVKGDVRITSDALHLKVYFDQQGTLCQRFKIKHSPTLVYQPEGEKKLVIEEVSVD